MVRVGELALTFLFHLHSQSHSLTIHHCPLRRSKQHVLFDPHIPVWYAVFSPKSRIFILFVFLFSLISYSGIRRDDGFGRSFQKLVRSHLIPPFLEKMLKIYYFLHLFLSFFFLPTFEDSKTITLSIIDT